jgi:carboxypeptidase family protein/tetratricopeptide repeat protein
MLHELPNVEKSSLRTGFLQVIFVNLAVIAWTPIAMAQISSSERTGGDISGIVLMEVGNRPASQVAVKLKSSSAGIFRSVLTDFDGQFEVRGLPPGTYEIIVDEPGYESARTSAQLKGPSMKFVLHLKSSPLLQTRGNGYMVSVRELRIPGKARDEYQKGLERSGNNDPAGSLSHFTKATKAFPDYYEAFYHIGVLEMGLNHKNEAMQAFQRAIDLSGGRYASAQFGLGKLLYLDGKTVEAESIIRRGLDVDQNSPDGHVLLGVALLRLKRDDDAARSAREALLREPDYAYAYLVLADVCARKGDYHAQLQNLDAYLRLEPNNPVSERVRQAREVVLRNLNKSHPLD